MAKQQGLLGHLSGRVGDKIYFVRNGVSYVRSLPKKSDKAPTEKQLIHRAKFTLVMGFIYPIITLLNESYRKINPKKTGTRMAVNQIFNDAIIGKYPDLEIDFPKVTLIRGNLQPPLTRMIYVAGTNELDFNWVVDSCYNGSSSDELLVLIYSSTQNEFWYDLIRGACRDDEFCTLRIPALFIGHEIHVWLGFQSRDRKAFSNSVYMGKVLTRKNDDHENV